MSDSTIRVEFKRSGGFAGVTVAANTDTDNLDDVHAAQVQRLLTVGEPSEVAGASPPAGADRFQYLLSVSDGKRQRSFSWDETTVPESIRPLLQTLASRARPVPIT